MLRTRIIPVLLMRRGGLVKTIRFRKPRYIGDPINVVRIFNEKEVDELILSEIVATNEDRSPDFDLLEQIAGEAFMPVCYGGAVRGVSDAKRILRLGMEKVSVNTAAIERPSIISELSAELGAQCVVASVDVKRTWRGAYEVYSHAGRRVPMKDPFAWIERLIKLGAGEILLTAVDRDGTMTGYDLELLKRLGKRFDVPIIACGGAGSVEHMKAAVATGAVNALGVGSRFIYQGPYNAVLVSYLSASQIAQIAVAGKDSAIANTL